MLTEQMSPSYKKINKEVDEMALDEEIVRVGPAGRNSASPARGKAQGECYFSSSIKRT
ncbi:MAG: hypothetical protein P4M11_15810 [Candidatus Pacebacteria bacterium]|nr:hypothetical protein [Candidatus Paceibacterota bacterium]